MVFMVLYPDPVVGLMQLHSGGFKVSWPPCASLASSYAGQMGHNEVPGQTLARGVSQRTMPGSAVLDAEPGTSRHAGCSADRLDQQHPSDEALRRPSDARIGREIQSVMDDLASLSSAVSQLCGRDCC